jgi:putative NADH-flavin reductase
MKIAIIGATGFVGSAVLNEALERGHQITAIARNIGKITLGNDRLTAIAADVEDVAGLAKILAGHQAVVSAYNAGWTNPSLYADFIKGSEGIQQATKLSGVKRLLVVRGAGSLEVAPGVQMVDTPGFPAEWKSGATAARDYLNILKKEMELDWTFISPAANLHPGKRTGKFRLGTDNPVTDGDGKNEISVQDMASAIIDELENNRFIKKRFTLGY